MANGQVPNWDPRNVEAGTAGLYELFADSGRVRGSLRSIEQALKPGGFLIYTHQPWRPQLEMIAHVLDNREGKPWVMRRRSVSLAQKTAVL
jgi:Putative methyltransferase